MNVISSYQFFSSYITHVIVSENVLKYVIMKIKHWEVWRYCIRVNGIHGYVVAQLRLLLRLTAATKCAVLEHKQTYYCFPVILLLVKVINIEATCQLGNSAGGGDVWAKGLSVP